MCADATESRGILTERQSRYNSRLSFSNQLALPVVKHSTHVHCFLVSGPTV